MNRKIYLLFLLFTSVLQNLSAQDFVGFNQSNFSGVNGVIAQPASAVDSRFKVDFNIGGFRYDIYNNYAGIKREAFKRINGSYPSFGDSLFGDKYLTFGQNKSAYAITNQISIMGPSAMINIDKKNAIAITTRVRHFMNIDGISESVAGIIVNALRDPNIRVNKINNQNFSFNTMSWAEYGATYARVLIDNDQHFFKAGITTKLLQGYQSMYMNINALDYKLTPQDSVVFYGANFNMGFSSIYRDETESDFNPLSFKLSAPGLGIDLGAVYEWRPKYQDYKCLKNGKSAWRNDINKYKLKIGIALLDLGSIRFNNSKLMRLNTPAQYTFAGGASPSLSQSQIEKIRVFADSIDAGFTPNKPANSFKTKLPTLLNVSIDYNIWRNIYLNLTPSIAFKHKNSNSRVYEYSRLILTPRIDRRFISFYMPFQYNALDGFRIGGGFRIGPLVLGTSNILPITGAITKSGIKNIYGADIYFALKFGIRHFKNRDRDDDGVKDKFDKCPDVVGLKFFEGCPDTDGDGIPDKDDRCLDIAGVKELQGCPDRDKDGITDKEDACPDLAGPKEKNGCPDKDGDKVTDDKDDCPDVFGLAEFNGCPDTDGDKVPDRFDICPTEPGLEELLGCPDKNTENTINIAGNLLFGENPSHAIANKMITLKNENGEIIDQTTTNEFGAFAFRNLDLNKNYNLSIEESDLPANVKIILTNKSGKEIKTLRTNEKGEFVFNLLDIEKTYLKNLSIEDNDLIMELKGYLYDQDKKPLSNAKINLYLNQSTVESIVTEENGKFNFKKLSSNSNYYFTIEDPNGNYTKVNKILVSDTKGHIYRIIYRNKYGNFKFDVLEFDKYTLGAYNFDDPWLEVLELKNKEQKQMITIVENLTYPSGSFKIDAAGLKILDKVITVLNINPKLSIEINSHTDSKSSDVFNLKLSQKRAQEAVNYITSKGIDPKRLKAVGFGESKLLNDCGNNKKCPEEKHAKNRRTEFKIIESEK